MRALDPLLAVLLLLSPGARAANWFVLDAPSATNGVGLEVDTDSLGPSSSRRREVTVRVSYADPRLNPNGASFRSVVVTLELECEGRVASYRDATFYSEPAGSGFITAREIGRLAASSPITRELLPAKNLESLIRAACSRPTPAVP